MTVLVGAVSEGVIHIGTDKLVTWSEDYCRPQAGGKFIYQDEDLVIADSGTVRISQTFENLVTDPSNKHLLNIEDIKSVEKLANILYDELKDLGVGVANNNEMPSHEFGFLLASGQTGKLYTINNDYAVEEWDSYVSMGSGSVIAEAAMFALLKAGVIERKAVQIALETACARHPFCGGGVELLDLVIQADPY